MLDYWGTRPEAMPLSPGYDRRSHRGGGRDHGSQAIEAVIQNDLESNTRCDGGDYLLPATAAMDELWRRHKRRPGPGHGSFEADEARIARTIRSGNPTEEKLTLRRPSPLPLWQLAADRGGTLWSPGQSKPGRGTQFSIGWSRRSSQRRLRPSARQGRASSSSALLPSPGWLWRDPYLSPVVQHGWNDLPRHPELVLQPAALLDSGAADIFSQK